MDSNFDYLEFTGSSLPRVVFLEGTTRQLYVEDEAEFGTYEEALEHLRDTAVTPQDSAKITEEIKNRQAQPLDGSGVLSWFRAAPSGREFDLAVSVAATRSGPVLPRRKEGWSHATCRIWSDEPECEDSVELDPASARLQEVSRW